MKKCEFKGLDLNYYTETLENGLEIVMIPMENKKNYFITYATRYGSDTTSFIPAGESKKIKVPDGVAHFLEHKMFEQEDGVDPFSFFSKSGTGANASTSFDHTQYICYGTKNFNENLRFLIQFVNSPYYTDENVEKEKGIIAEELNMYNDLPDFRLEMKLRENLYHKSPRKVDIGGTVESIQDITKKVLYKCYDSFYTPNNMFIVIAGNFDIKDASRIIYEELELKENRGMPIVENIEEDVSVRRAYEKMTANIEIPKLAFGLKMSTDKFSVRGETLDMYLSMLTSLLFGSSSDFRERMNDKKLITNMYTEWETVEDIKVFYIMAESNKPKELLDEINKELENFELDKDTFERIKKVWIANEVRISDDVNATVRSVFNEIMSYGKVIDDDLKKIRKLDYKELVKISKMIDFNNTSSVIMLPDAK